MEMSALTRSIAKGNHAIIAPDGYVNSNVPGWTNCTVNVMSRTRRQFSVEQKLAILNEADQNGVTQTLRKHNLSHSVFLR